MPKYVVTIHCSFSVDVTVAVAPTEMQLPEESIEELIQQRALAKHEADGDWSELAPAGLTREVGNIEKVSGKPEPIMPERDQRGV